MAKIALSSAIFAIDRPYDYLVPQEWEDTIQVGMRVLVPFGAGNRRVDGLVLALTRAEHTPRLKPVLSLLDSAPVLSTELLKLALWMRERYFCTVYEAARAMLPAGLAFSIKDRYHIREGVSREQAEQAAGSSERARQLLELLYANGGKMEIGDLRVAFGPQDPMPTIRQLMEAEVLTLETGCTRAVGDKLEQMAVLAVSVEEAMAQVTPKRKTAPLRYAVMELLCMMGRASVKELCYFTGASSSTIRSLKKSGLIVLEKEEQYRRVEIGSIPPAEPVVLNEEQQTAVDGLNALLHGTAPEAALLYGVTGSGKTQVYLALIRRVLEQGRSALVLVPEIALTPQFLRLFTAHFGDDIAVLHSSLRAGERYDEWKRIRAGQAHVVLGTRSAVFAPLENLGLIVVDEEQESSYKSENTPRYHAVETAKFRCVQNNALLLLGSATPSVESFYRAKQGIYHLFQLQNRYNAKALPAVRIADMKQEMRQGNGGLLSQPLREELARNIERGEQSILFLNRRGAHRMLSCGLCGHVPECPRCSVHLTYHSANGRLMCHHCGHSEPKREVCPLCGGLFDFIGAGTQWVEEELHQLFPETEVLRMDTDTISASQSHDALLTRFQEERIPILLGTQMVAKGLDFERVTLVGVLAADLSLYLDDHRAGERTFSLITQVVGRAGRGEKQGRAVIQTWTPENETIVLASQQNYDAFYEQEIQLRRIRSCPPFSTFFVLTAVGPDEHKVLHACQRLRNGLEQQLARSEYAGYPVQVFGPAPASVLKVKDRYRYRVTLSAPNRKEIRALVAHLVRTAQKDKENRGISVFADADPQD